MRNTNYIQLIFLILLVYSTVCHAQKIKHNGGIMLTTEITVGNQNDWLKLGLFGFGALNYKGASLEAGASVNLKQLLKRHTLTNYGRSYAFEFFGMLGGGNNQDLIGSVVSTQNNVIFSTPLQNSTFIGVGFGFEKEILPKELDIFSLRRGKFLMRYSHNNINFNVAFLNDFKAGKLFYGEGTDFGETGSFIAGVTKRNAIDEIYQIGYGITLFTPPADYTRSPRNQKNSDFGRKNVWYNLKDVPQIYYANSYLYGTYQKNSYAFHTKLGIESNKMGARIQNKLHDGFGLNPRYPWDTNKKNNLYYEFEAAVFYNTLRNE